MISKHVLMFCNIKTIYKTCIFFILLYNKSYIYTLYIYIIPNNVVTGLATGDLSSQTVPPPPKCRNLRFVLLGGGGVGAVNTILRHQFQDPKQLWLNVKRTRQVTFIKNPCQSFTLAKVAWHKRKTTLNVDLLPESWQDDLR